MSPGGGSGLCVPPLWTNHAPPTAILVQWEESCAVFRPIRGWPEWRGWVMAEDWPMRVIIAVTIVHHTKWLTRDGKWSGERDEEILGEGAHVCVYSNQSFFATFEIITHKTSNRTSRNGNLEVFIASRHLDRIKSSLKSWSSLPPLHLIVHYYYANMLLRCSGSWTRSLHCSPLSVLLASFNWLV